MVAIAPALQGLEPYDPGFVAADVLLSANENNYGVPEKVRQAMLAAVAEQAFNRYPDPMANALRDAIAAWHGVSRENVVVGNGGDELIFNLLLAFGGPGRTLVNCPPTFSIYALYSQLTSTAVNNVPRNPETFAPDFEGMAAVADANSIVMVTTPNNPTGNVCSAADIARLAQATQALVVADEAYFEFARGEESCAALVKNLCNVAVLRTFSKAFGLAGVRCGYLLASPEVIRGLSAVRQPYSVDVCAQAIASVAVDMRAAFEPAIEAIRASRDELVGALNALPGVKAWPSEANFILVRMPNAHGVYGALRDEHSILVRDFSSAPMLEDCLRISVGTPAENARLLAALSAMRQDGALE